MNGLMTAFAGLAVMAAMLVSGYLASHAPTGIVQRRHR